MIDVPRQHLRTHQRMVLCAAGVDDPPELSDMTMLMRAVMSDRHLAFTYNGGSQTILVVMKDDRQIFNSRTQKVDLQKVCQWYLEEIK